jgi:hypothetical protein
MQIDQAIELVNTLVADPLGAGLVLALFILGVLGRFEVVRNNPVYNFIASLIPNKDKK